LPVANRDEVKRTNEIKMAIPLLDAIDIKGKEVSADALLTQRPFARYLVEERQAHYHFTVKATSRDFWKPWSSTSRSAGNPIRRAYAPDHGRLETRKIWTTTELNGYLDFPYVGQAFVIERQVTEKRPAPLRGKSPTASPVEPPPRLARNAFSRSIAGIGSSRTVAITFSIGTTMKTAVASAPATARKTSPAAPLRYWRDQIPRGA